MKRSSTYSGFRNTNAVVQAVHAWGEKCNSFFSPLFFSQLINATEINLLTVEKKRQIWGTNKEGTQVQPDRKEHHFLDHLQEYMLHSENDVFHGSSVGTNWSRTMAFLHHSFHMLAWSEIAGWGNPCLLCKWAGAMVIMVLQAPEFAEQLQWQEQSVSCFWMAHEWLVCRPVDWDCVCAEGKCVSMWLKGLWGEEEKCHIMGCLV